MRWYEGSIAEAVTLSKQKNAIFVVFVEGQNELSTEMASAIDREEVLQRLSDPNNFLAVKLQSGTTNYTHFAQLYQLVPVPSLFFIGRNGTPLEVVCAGIEPDNLAARIDRILSQFHKDKEISQPLTVQPSTSFQQAKQESANLLQSEAQKQSEPLPPSVAKSPEEKRSIEAAGLEDLGSASKIQKKEYEIVCEGDVCIRREKTSDGAGTSQSSSLPSEVASGAEQMDVASSSATQIQNETKQCAPDAETSKAESSESATSMDKIERAKELMEARKREKAEKEKELEKQRELERRAAGQGVAELKRWQADQELKQIQEERRREKLENNLARQRILEQIAQDRAERRARDEPAAAPPAPAPPQGDIGNQARLSFKLPDGTSHTVQFDADQTLEDVTRYVSDNLHLSASAVALWTAFPRRELAERTRTLRQLRLAPSAALLLLPRRAPAPAPAPWTSLMLLLRQLLTSLVMSPAAALYAWVVARLPGARPATGGAPPPAYRRKTTVHRLTGDPSDNDDNNTWNGNSTQQM